MIIDYNTVTLVDHTHCAFAVGALAINRGGFWFIFKPREHIITFINDKRVGGQYGALALMQHNNFSGDDFVYDVLNDKLLRRAAEWMSAQLHDEPNKYDERKAFEFLQAALVTTHEQFDGP